MTNLWWECPKCNKKVDFSKQLEDIFDIDYGEAYFSVDKDCGLWFHTIMCECGSSWIMSISGMEEE